MGRVSGALTTFKPYANSQEKWSVDPYVLIELLAGLNLKYLMSSPEHCNKLDWIQGNQY